MKRVLHVVSAPHRGGAETMIMNVLRESDPNKIRFDFISHVPYESDYDREIDKFGGKVIHIESLGKAGPYKYIKSLMHVINNYGPYEAVHCHTNLQASMVMIAAYLTGVRIRITHSHNTMYFHKKSLVNSIISAFSKGTIKLFSTNYLACGDEAAVAMFGEKKFVSGKVSVIKNGIDIDKFIKVYQNEKLRSEVRKELNVKHSDFLIGHIGRYHDQKNHEFIIELGKRLALVDTDWKILLIGTGENYNKISQLINDYQLNSHVFQLGVREDIERLYAALDLFILPSRYEGLPLVMVEAQTAGKNCLVSNKISNEADMGLNLVEFLPIDDLEIWVKEIQKKKLNVECPDKKTIISKINSNGYSVESNVDFLTEIYYQNTI